MSRPYININTSTYNSNTDVVTFDVTALRLRGETSLSVSGFAGGTITIPLSDGRYLSNESTSFTFSRNINGTSSNNLYGGESFSPATAVFEFSGTASGGATTTNVKISVWGSGTTASGATNTYTLFGAGGYTFSATQSASTAVVTLAANISSLPTGATATTSGNTLTITAPYHTGAYYNGNTAAILPSQAGTSGWTFSSTYYSGTWSGGVTTITVPVTATNFGQLETQVFYVS